MGNILYLAHSEGGWGLNFDILETNIINLAILIGVLLVYGSKFLGKILSERRAAIEAEIKDAENRAATAKKALEEEQRKLSQAQAEAKKIREQAAQTAASAKEKILAQGQVEVERIKASAAQDLQSEQDKAIAELKKRVAALALERVEAQLQETLDDAAQNQLIDRCIAQLGGS
ncbi:MAG: F0F1 ATP synthase subunit B [Jaaginema sp. PMC 1079.18]|nr:F0F1 ATP synthase subunit B [Jaaginema sp. PMC 1080.18]MEC4851298.1 F0F1 ATP synthase subunit B [Jaaginema sp. PMC 1079.18]MEC4867120.1 F0F1 ATP synthase subunit B [Jaaginema sp. PMC 1078.18]